MDPQVPRVGQGRPVSRWRPSLRCNAMGPSERGRAQGLWPSGCGRPLGANFWLQVLLATLCLQQLLLLVQVGGLALVGGPKQQIEAPAQIKQHQCTKTSSQTATDCYWPTTANLTQLFTKTTPPSAPSPFDQTNPLLATELLRPQTIEPQHHPIDQNHHRKITRRRQRHATIGTTTPVTAKPSLFTNETQLNNADTPNTTKPQTTTTTTPPNNNNNNQQQQPSDSNANTASTTFQYEDYDQLIDIPELRQNLTKYIISELRTHDLSDRLDSSARAMAEGMAEVFTLSPMAAAAAALLANGSSPFGANSSGHHPFAATNLSGANLSDDIGPSGAFTPITTPRPYLGDLFHSFLSVYWPFHRALGLIICILGVFANVTNIIVLTRPHMITAVNIILSAMAMSDLIVNVSNIPYLVEDLGESVTLNFYWALYTLFHAHTSVTAHTISIWLTCVLATWRYFVVCRSQSTSQRNWSVSLAKRTIVAVLLFVPVFCIPNYLSFAIITETTYTNQTVYKVGFSQLADKSQFIKTFHFWIFSFLTKLVPCVLLTFFTTALIRKLLSARERRLRLAAHGSREHNNGGKSGPNSASGGGGGGSGGINQFDRRHQLKTSDSDDNDPIMANGGLKMGEITASVCDLRPIKSPDCSSKETINYAAKSHQEASGRNHNSNNTNPMGNNRSNQFGRRPHIITDGLSCDRGNEFPDEQGRSSSVLSECPDVRGSHNRSQFLLNSGSSCATDAEILPASSNTSSSGQAGEMDIATVIESCSNTNISASNQQRQLVLSQLVVESKSLAGALNNQTTITTRATNMLALPNEADTTQDTSSSGHVSGIGAPISAPNNSNNTNNNDANNSSATILNQWNLVFDDHHHHQPKYQHQTSQQIPSIRDSPRSASTCGALESYSSKSNQAGSRQKLLQYPMNDGSTNDRNHSGQELAASNQLKPMRNSLGGSLVASSANNLNSIEDPLLCKRSSELTKSSTSRVNRSIGSTSIAPFQMVKLQATQRQLSQNETTTRLLIAVMIVFLICESPAGILSVLCAILGQEFFDNVYQPMGPLTDLLALINSSVNFILYCFMSTQFRITFYQVVLHCPAPNVAQHQLGTHAAINQNNNYNHHNNNENNNVQKSNKNLKNNY